MTDEGPTTYIGKRLIGHLRAKEARAKKLEEYMKEKKSSKLRRDRKHARIVERDKKRRLTHLANQNKLNDSQKERAFLLRRENKTVKELAQMFGIPYIKMYRLLKKEGLAGKDSKTVKVIINE